MADQPIQHAEKVRAVRAALVEVFGYSQFQYLNNADLDAKIERLTELLNDGWAHAPQCEESDQRSEAVAFPLTKQEVTLLTQALEFYLGSALGPRPAHEDLRGRLATLIDGPREGRTVAIEPRPQ